MNRLIIECHPLSRLLRLSGLVLAAVLSGCGSDAPEKVKPVPIAIDQPAPTTESYSMLEQKGTIWVNQEGQKVSLRGINLGNWLAMEMWMFGGDESLGEGIPDQCTLEAKMTERFGQAEKNRLIDLHRDSWITEADWDVMQDAGFNLVRIPFLYDLIEDDNNPMTVKADAWKYLDWAIAMAKARNMYVVLDLHGAAGRQGSEQHSGCAGQNMLWGSESYQQRTSWLWKQIAAKYKSEPVVAGYGLLNEPWGTDSETLKDVVVDLYNAVREEDQKHIVILPGHNSDGISAYGDPLDLGMDNVAFEMHFYPGLFGAGEIGYEVHRDWLTCGPNGDAGVCSWAKQARDVFTPMFVGEMQPWTGLGKMGGDITRATFDKYNELNWAATAWSLKTVSPSGGIGNGPWGLTTNNGDQLLAKAETWSCNNWESTFAEACAVPTKSTVPYQGEGSKTMYLVIKTGSFNGTDVTYDNLALTQDATGTNVIQNGDFGSADNWTELAVWGDPRNYDFSFAAGEFAGTDTGLGLNVTAPAGHNSFIYQAVQVEGGQSYTLSGKFKDNGDTGSDMWAEIYLVPNLPIEGVDVSGRVLPEVNVNSSSVEDIAAYFTAFADMDYVANADVINALKSSTPANIFVDIPNAPSELMLNVNATSVSLAWKAEDGNGYRVYRSTAPRSGFEVIAETTGGSYLDESILADTTYYYYVSAFTSTDESYPSNIEASGDTFYTLPTFIEAENYTAAHPGVNTEGAGDIGGGFNVGSFETDRWVDYGINIPTAGTYTAEFRVASLVGDVQFDVMVAGEALSRITVPNTGGWQDYVTLAVTLELPAGQSTLRLNSVDNQWNLNWMRFTAGATEPTPEPEPEPTPEPEPAPSPISGQDFALALPDTATGGTNANVSLVSDEEKTQNVLSLEVLASDGVDQGYAAISFSVMDLSLHSLLHFDMKDTQGSNTAYVTFVDEEGATWSKWTDDSTTLNEWSTLSLDYTEAAASVDLTKIVEIRVAQWNAGTYFLADFTLIASMSNSLAITLPETPTGGTNANATLVDDTDKTKNVLSLEVIANDGIDQGYAGYSFAPMDWSIFDYLTFDLKDTQGSNTTYITILDESGASWSAWTDDKSELELWASISFNYSMATGIDLTKVVEIRFAQWNAGVYLISDLVLLQSIDDPILPTGESDFVVLNPSEPMGGSNASISVVTDADKNTDVINLSVLANDNIDQGYAAWSFSEIDFSLFQSLTFDLKDLQGSNTAYVTLVDNTGATWSAWTEDSSALNTWTVIGFNYADASGIDLNAIVEVRIAQWNAGEYLVTDLTLIAPTEEQYVISLPASPMGGSNATVSLVNDSDKAADVLSLQVLANDGIDQGYASVTLDNLDVSSYSNLLFDIKDTQGNNTAYITFVDATGATASAWTEASSTLDTWVTIDLNFTGLSGIDLSQIAEIRVSEWNAGVYLLAEFKLTK